MKITVLSAAKDAAQKYAPITTPKEMGGVPIPRIFISDVYNVKPYFKKKVIKEEIERLNKSGVFNSL